MFPALFFGREIFTAYLLPFLWQCGDNYEIAEIVLQILTNIGSTAFSESDSAENTSIPWWASNEDFISRLIEKFILHGKKIVYYLLNLRNFYCFSFYNKAI